MVILQWKLDFDLHSHVCVAQSCQSNGVRRLDDFNLNSNVTWLTRKKIHVDPSKVLD